VKSYQFVIALCFVMSLPSETFGQRPTEYEVKAAFLYNFARFVTWPVEAFEQPDSPVVIGVYGKNPFGARLERTVQNKTVNARHFVVQQVHRLEDMRACHILFIAASEAQSLAQVKDSLRATPVLTISEQPGFCMNGGIINFFLHRDRVRFEINPNAAERAGLAISSRLLKLAQIARDMSSEAP